MPEQQNTANVLFHNFEHTVEISLSQLLVFAIILTNADVALRGRTEDATRSEQDYEKT